MTNILQISKQKIEKNQDHGDDDQARPCWTVSWMLLFLWVMRVFRMIVMWLQINVSRLEQWRRVGEVARLTTPQNTISLLSIFVMSRRLDRGRSRTGVLPQTPPQPCSHTITHWRNTIYYIIAHVLCSSHRPALLGFIAVWTWTWDWSSEWGEETQVMGQLWQLSVYVTTAGSCWY